MLVKRQFEYIVPDETEDGDLIIYVDNEGDYVCPSCCNRLSLVPFDMEVIAPDDPNYAECNYCTAQIPHQPEEAEFSYDTSSDHDRYYLTVTCDICHEIVHEWADDDAREFIDDNCPLNRQKWYQPIWEFLNDNNLLHYH